MTKEERMEKLNKRMIEGQCDNWYHEFESNCREYSPNNSLIYIRGGINLESIDGRFKRARESWSLLNCEMKEFCNKWQSHFKFIEKRKINFYWHKNEYRDYFIYEFQKDLPNEIRWSIILGEILSHYREILDNIIPQLILVNIEIPKRSQFPIIGRHEGWKSKHSKMLEGINPADKEKIKKFAKYVDIRDLSNLCNKNKHRIPIPTSPTPDLPFDLRDVFNMQGEVKRKRQVHVLDKRGAVKPKLEICFGAELYSDGIYMSYRSIEHYINKYDDVVDKVIKELSEPYEIYRGC